MVNNNKTEYIIDPDDVERVGKFIWKLDKRTGYFVCRNPLIRKTISLHRFIIGADSFGSDCIVDHINRIRHDNRKSNLRITSYLFNNWNKGLDKRNKTGRTGVYKTPEGRYRVTIGVMGKNIDLGSYKNKNMAIIVRENAEKEYWK